MTLSTSQLICHNRGGESKAHRYWTNHYADSWFNRDVEWRVIGLYLAKNDSHGCSVVPNGARASRENEVLCGELASAICLIRERLEYQFPNHATFPVSCPIKAYSAVKLTGVTLQVMVFSITGNQARVVQFYLDEGSGDLIVRPSKYVDILTDPEALPLMASWMMCSACGDTRHPNTIKTADPKSVEIRSTQKAVGV